MDEQKRGFLRVTPSKKNPVGVRFRWKELGEMSTMIQVADISIGGIGLQIPDASSVLKLNQPLDYIELLLPGAGTGETCVFSGVVTFLRGDTCGIEFQQGGEYELRKVARYIQRREMEIMESERLNREGKAVAAPVKQKEERPLTVGRILIVDDSEPLILSYTELFTKNGFEVIAATNGVEGLKQALETQPDLILMDINMPLMSGHECTRLIKNHPTTKHITVWMLTTGSEQSDVIRSLKAGAKSYLIKSMDKNTILERVQQFFSSSE